jgi:hypothetical protein
VTVAVTLTVRSDSASQVAAALSVTETSAADKRGTARLGSPLDRHLGPRARADPVLLGASRPRTPAVQQDETCDRSSDGREPDAERRAPTGSETPERRANAPWKHPRLRLDRSP